MTPQPLSDFAKQSHLRAEAMCWLQAVLDAFVQNAVDAFHVQMRPDGVGQKIILSFLVFLSVDGAYAVFLYAALCAERGNQAPAAVVRIKKAMQIAAVYISGKAAPRSAIV